MTTASLTQSEMRLSSRRSGRLSMLADRLFRFGLRAAPIGVARATHVVFVALSRIRQVLCATRGHDPFLVFERRRLSLHCADCGWDSPGWTLDRSTPHVTSARMSSGPVLMATRPGVDQTLFGSRDQLGRAEPVSHERGEVAASTMNAQKVGDARHAGVEHGGIHEQDT